MLIVFQVLAPAIRQYSFAELWVYSVVPIFSVQVQVVSARLSRLVPIG